MEKKLHTLLQALQSYHPQRIILFGSAARGEADPDALAPPAVPFESYTHEQGERAVMAVQTLLALVTQKFAPAAGQP